MPTITGDITDHGAVICILVGVGAAKRSLLQRLKMPIPQPISVRAQIDTGSHVTGFSRDVFNALNECPFGRMRLRTPSTRPGEPFFADQYALTITFVSGMSQYTFRAAQVIASDDFQQGEEVEAIIGRDVLNCCNFQYIGTARQFKLFI
jgi:hypothetical protein